jgi:hypothetical protein
MNITNERAVHKIRVRIACINLKRTVKYHWSSSEPITIEHKKEISKQRDN